LVTKETGMASETRHAAWQTERSFAVKVLPEEGPPADLAGGFSEFLDAFDVAVEWVNREDPPRDGAATLAIFETRDGVTEEVWTYPPAQPGAADNLVVRLGFNPLTWTGRRGFSSAVPRLSGSTPRSTAAPDVAQPEQRIIPTDFDAAPIDTTERATVPATAAPRPFRARVRATWDDPLSRCCLLCSGGSLWFSLSFADANFLVLLGASLPALWWRQRGRGASAAAIDDEDWF
jgi:hypothetical protein